MSNQPNEYDVAAEVKKLTESWNPPATDRTLEVLVGVPTDPADVAATAHITPEGLQKFSSSKVDAQRLQEFQDDGDDVDLESADKATLQNEAEKRGLSKSGNKDELLERIQEHDEGDGDES